MKPKKLQRWIRRKAGIKKLRMISVRGYYPGMEPISVPFAINIPFETVDTAAITRRFLASHYAQVTEPPKESR